MSVPWYIRGFHLLKMAHRALEGFEALQSVAGLDVRCLFVGVPAGSLTCRRTPTILKFF